MKNNKSLIFDLIPSIGILVFLGLYLYASTLYPGGSQSNLDSLGYDWLNNYWCDLYTIKNPPNPARPIAIVAMIVLCLSLMIFFIQFTQAFYLSGNWKTLMRYGGTLSMLFATLIFTSYHDSMILLSSLFGLFPVIGIILGIYKSNLKTFKITLAISLVFLFINNVIYYSQLCLQLLPFLQKITFLVVLLWIVTLNFEIIKRKVSFNKD